ncbi:2-oxoglutarate (2OG) and Fe(II)-dependent oxygenase superfamily protein [Striga hermonthica]|uniref:2-oxoglutarate (2OG) and Fe(II)-dependent oxygenase superfamily protein n=1 Tax=Striga hermonthica TaxID=68872 RepID=A0A9N7N200_STRHE|nr:2-oxoglutarate (2OG) and Fe(II)-dependent oxygenase superfamily protein [Striga hermonthica]
MAEVDDAFIQPSEHRPEPHRTIQAQNIPLIDLSGPAICPSGLISQIGDACRDWGFFQAINHGVPAESRRNVELAARKFFALPKEEKNKVARDRANPFGYYDSEHTKNVRDWKEVFDFAVENPVIAPTLREPDRLELRELFNKWPQGTPELREACELHAIEMEKLAFKLLGLIALSLGLPEDRFNRFFKDQTSRVRLNHYPPCPSPHLTLGVGRHKDTGVLTILAQDNVPGLQVKRKTDGEWILVKPTPDAYIINVGDIIQVWSNDKYESVEHRAVVNSDKERLSIPYFLYPAHYTWVEPVKELVDEQNPARFKGYNWGKFRATRNYGNLRKLDVENIQISHFRI